MELGMNICTILYIQQTTSKSLLWSTGSSTQYLVMIHMGKESKKELVFHHQVVWPKGLQHARLPCSSLSPWVCSKSCPLSWWCHPTISSSVTPFSSCPQSFPASGSFPMSQFTSRAHSIGAWASASASVLPMNIQSWFPLGLMILISLQSQELSRVLSSTTIWKHQFKTSIHECWKNHCFDYRDFSLQSDVSVF